MDDNITPNDLPDVNNQAPDGAVSEVSEVKDILSEALGKDFPDNETALKSVKDTFDYVGKAGKLEKVLSEVKEQKGFTTDEEAIAFIKDGISKDSDYVSKKDLAERDFFGDNPQLKEYKSVIKAMANDKGIGIEEVVKSEDFKPFLDKVLAHDKSESNKSVLHSNPRISSAIDKMAKAKEASSQGNQNEAEKSAVGAVLDAFETED